MGKDAVWRIESFQMSFSKLLLFCNFWKSYEYFCLNFSDELICSLNWCDCKISLENIHTFSKYKYRTGKWLCTEYQEIWCLLNFNTISYVFPCYFLTMISLWDRTLYLTILRKAGLKREFFYIFTRNSRQNVGTSYWWLKRAFASSQAGKIRLT